ncbi:docking domain of Afi1 for Arf3 in vesicle trafficking-domain-containing protein [Mycena maculata]|uniref:Docking domain of Afi1 for Arf3 in vesicle trafficking-domain-containing protein n=1 Tax=Mycena maculata TaxID=230809 RepID=A0AAD7KBP6_9AGAR|nr:docking domain of Afi1 for Arf3 in vesicle trafficking-domain-containing protein [Mycena maculata]
MGSDGGHCSFVLLAEFDILAGAQLKYQFPQPLGVDESVLAMSMLPDGAETQLDDWTIFFLNQTAFNTISPVLALDTPEVKTTALDGEPAQKPDLLCVLNLVRTKHDKTLDRGAKVLALAICTRHPFIQIFKPVLLMALDDYFSDPSQDCLARLFDAVNSMNLSAAPILTRNEKMVMRSSDRKDIFAEKFGHGPPPLQGWNNGKSLLQHRSTNSGESFSSFEEGILMRNKDRDEATMGAVSVQQPTAQSSPSEASFSLGGSAVWVGDESGLDTASGEGGGEADSIISFVGSSTVASTHRRRRSTDASSGSSQAHAKDGMLRPSMSHTPSSFDPYMRSGAVKDTHFFHTTVVYKDHQLPIKMPLATFPEEVGDYSLITLIKAFSSQTLVSGPLHPHLHTNGPQTHPIIILFNALVTGKRIIFLGHKKPAGEVSSFVLSACALGSGCGAVLRGFIERSFPYANLNNKDEWEAVPAYIAGVTNPIFKSSPTWDLLLDISAGSVTVARDIHTTYPTTGGMPLGIPSLVRSATFSTEGSLGSEEDMVRAGNAKADNNADNLFIEDIKSAIEYHYGESLVRVRFTEYVLRFVRLASRYEEDMTGSTKFGYPSSAFDNRAPNPRLGSGIVFNDESAGRKELAANSHRIEAWRKTNSYEYICADFRNAQLMDAIQGFDVSHQLFRLRNAKSMSDAEVSTIMRTLAENVKTYDQVIELLAYLMPHGGGLLHIAFCLFHQKESVREATVDLFNQLRAYPVGVLFLQALNHFQRYAYVRQAHAREKRLVVEQQQYQQPPPQQQPPFYSSTSFNRTYSTDRMVTPTINGGFQ